MPRSRRPFTKGTKKIQSKIWQLSSGIFGTSAGTAALLFATPGGDPTTILRIRGEISGWVDGTQAPAKAALITYGIIQVPEGTGSTVVWDPFSDANAPWLLYGQAVVGYEEMVTDVVDVPGLSSFRHVIDNKAMRILRPDIELQFAVTNTTVGGALGVNLNYGLRWLQGF